ncbi:MAG: glycosyltransferase involved in cell wall biosynthesis [Alteromonadaceae bacterium]|jgi:glycosyltransferase involved in cell wall biosynthesis
MKIVNGFYNMMNKNKISICISTFNRCQNLQEAVTNIFLQTYKNFELIIINDGSTDNTQGVLNSLKVMFPEIIIVNNKSNLGLSKSRNIALCNASGKWFTFIDDDDVWSTTYLEQSLLSVETSGSDACFSGAIVNGKPMNYRKKTTTVRDALFCGHTPPVGAQFYKLSELKKVGGYDENIKTGVDHDLWLSLAAKNNIKCIFEDFSLVTPDKIANSNTVKMTTDISKRVGGIEASILKWKDRLEEIGGKKFYSYFKQEYRYYLQRRFFMMGLRQRNINLILTVFNHKWLKNRKVYFFVRLCGYILQKKVFYRKSDVSQFKAFK